MGKTCAIAVAMRTLLVVGLLACVALCQTFYDLTEPVQDPRLQFPVSEIVGVGEVTGEKKLQNVVVNNFLDPFPNFNNLRVFSMTGDYDNNRAFISLGLKDRTVVREVDFDLEGFDSMGDVMKGGHLYFRNAPRIFWREDRKELWSAQPIEVSVNEDKNDDDENFYVHVGRLNLNLEINDKADTYYRSVRLGAQVYWDEQEKLLATANNHHVTFINVAGNVARTWRYALQPDNVYALATAYDPNSHRLFIACMYFQNIEGIDTVGGVRVYVADPTDPIGQNPVAEEDLAAFPASATNPSPAGRPGLGGARFLYNEDGTNTFQFLVTNGDQINPVGETLYSFTLSGSGSELTGVPANGLRNIIQSSNIRLSGNGQSLSNIKWTHAADSYTSIEVSVTPTTVLYA